MYSPETSGDFSILSYATHCNTRYTLQHIKYTTYSQIHTRKFSTWAMQQTATHCNTLQHTFIYMFLTVYMCPSNTGGEIFNLSYVRNRRPVERVFDFQPHQHTLFCVCQFHTHIFNIRLYIHMYIDNILHACTLFSHLSMRFSASAIFTPVSFQCEFVYQHTYTFNIILHACGCEPHQHTLFRVCHFYTHIFNVRVYLDVHIDIILHAYVYSAASACALPRLPFSHLHLPDVSLRVNLFIDIVSHACGCEPHQHTNIYISNVRFVYELTYDIMYSTYCINDVIYYFCMLTYISNIRFVYGHTHETMKPVWYTNDVT